MKNKVMWKDVALIVLTILLIISMCRIHTLHLSLIHISEPTRP